MAAPRSLKHSTILVGFIVALAAVAAAAGLHAVFVSWDFLWPAAVGAVVGLVALGIAHRWSLLLGESVGLSLVLFVGAGICVAGFSPLGFFRGLVEAWSDLLTATEPADLTAKLRVVPFTLAWLGTTAGGELARWTRIPSLPIVGPLVALALTVLIGDEHRTVSLVQGAVLAAAALAIGVIQQRARRGELPGDDVAGSPVRSRRAMRAAAAITLIAAAAPFIGPRLPLADANDRFDLRQCTDPPWDPLSAPSPLVEVKAALAEARRDEPVFEVNASQPISHWQLAVLGDYDGTVWTVGSGSADAAAEFRPVDTRMPRAPKEDRSHPTATATVTIAGGGGHTNAPWLPIPGRAKEFSFASGKAPDGQRLRANLATGTLALAGGVPAGLRYEVTSYLPSAAPDGDLLAASVHARIASERELEALPPQVKNLAADLLEGHDLGWEQVVAIRDSFVNTGFYDATPRAQPGHSYFRLSTFLQDPARIVGFEEQYAAAAAVTMRAAQLPARVVVGYVIPAERWTNGTATARSGDISAWVEVEVSGYGWVPVDVTPPRTRTPQERTQGVTVEDVAIPNPPPPPQLPPSIQVLSNEEKEPPEEQLRGSWERQLPSMSSGSRATIIAGSTGGLIAAVLAVIILAKAWRRRQRRRAGQPADRISGAWLELADRCREAKILLPKQVTPTEAARAVLDDPASHAELPTAELMGLVAAVDRAAFHAEPPDDQRAAAAWGYCDDVVTALRRQRSVGRRAMMRIDPRPLRHRDPAELRRRR